MNIWIWSVLGLIGVLGLLAVASPRWFAIVANQSNRAWVDTSKVLAPLDKQVDIDQYVLRHSRLLGAAVLAAVALIATVLIFRLGN